MRTFRTGTVVREYSVADVSGGKARSAVQARNRSTVSPYCRAEATWSDCAVVPLSRCPKGRWIGALHRSFRVRSGLPLTGGNRLRCQAFPYVGRQDATFSECRRDQVAECVTSLTWTLGDDNFPRRLGVASKFREYLRVHEVNVVLGTFGSVGVYAWSWRNDHCCTVGGCLVDSAVGGEKTELVVGLADVPMRDQSGWLLFTLGFKGKPQVVSPAPSRVASTSAWRFARVGAEQGPKVGQSRLV